MTIFLLANYTDAYFWRIEGGGFFWRLTALGMSLLDSPPIPCYNDARVGRNEPYSDG